MREIRVLSLVTIAVLAALWDLKEGRIPNALTAAALAMGFAWQCFALGFEGIPAFLGGVLVPALFFALPGYFHMIGAGDIKLLMAAGAFLGAKGALRCIFFSLAAAAAFALVLILKNHAVTERARFLYAYLRDYSKSGVRSSYLEQAPESAKLCFAVPVVIGVLCSI